MDKVSDLIGRVLRRRGLHQVAAASHAVYLANAWMTKSAPEIRAFARAVSVREGVLIIACQHQVAAQEMAQRSEELLSFLKSELSPAPTAVRCIRATSRQSTGN